MAVARLKRSGAKAKRSSAKARKAQQRSPAFQGWNTTDIEEVERRQWRGLTDITTIEALEPEQPYFGTFLAHSGGGNSYEVEIRSLEALENTTGRCVRCGVR